MVITVGGITLYGYGLIVGMGVALGWWLAERKVIRYGLPVSDFHILSGVVLVCGLIGARTWHVLTDWSLYAANLKSIAYVNEGGLSILGALVGGVSGVAAWTWWRQWRRDKEAGIFAWMDIAALSLPIAQAWGRLANWVNQELYGLPTNLPWGIFIDKAHRLPEYAEYSMYHPLFAYESILLVMLAGGLWWTENRVGKEWFGQGWYWWAYLSGYSMIRFWLEYIRIDKALIPGFSLGVNQLIMAGVGIVALIKWRQVTQKIYEKNV
jgi:phosphatidylglycerol---prolipoprotein diacylglyceryl transferase